LNSPLAKSHVSWYSRPSLVDKGQVVHSLLPVTKKQVPATSREPVQ
jgi:hypothetical protein